MNDKTSQEILNSINGSWGLISDAALKHAELGGNKIRSHVNSFEQGFAELYKRLMEKDSKIKQLESKVEELTVASIPE